MKRDLPAYVYRRRSRGREYLYYEKGAVRERMPDFPSDEFWLRYAALQRKLPAKPSRYTWTALVALYRQDKRWTKLAARTRADYEKPMDALLRGWGTADPRRVKRSHILAVMRENSYRYRWANDFKTVVSQCLDVAMDHDWLTENVAKTISPVKPESRLGRQPWPQDLIEAFRKEAPVGTRARLVFELCLGTGQRIGDVLHLRWGDCEPDGISFQQSKTGRRLGIPYTAHLRDVLGRTDKRGVHVVADAQGRPLTYRQAQDAVMRVRRKIGAEAYDIHALRHTAASELAALGLSDEHIKAITGHHSTAMVRRYSEAARQRARAKEAQEKRR